MLEAELEPAQLIQPEDFKLQSPLQCFLISPNLT
jgi:hypothetical protein